MASLADSLSSHDDDCMSFSDEDTQQSSIYGSNVGMTITQQNNNQLVRKRTRQRLDHLTQAEKMARRKMKNRIAAQTARDKKRAMVDKLEEENKILKRENERLRQKLALFEFNVKKQELEFTTDAIPTINTTIPNPSNEFTDAIIDRELELNQSSDGDRITDAPIETAALVNVPRQKEQGVTIRYPTSMNSTWTPGWTPVHLALILTILKTHQYSSKTKCSAHSKSDCVARSEHLIHLMMKTLTRNHFDSKKLTRPHAANGFSRYFKDSCEKLSFISPKRTLYSKRRLCKMKTVILHNKK